MSKLKVTFLTSFMSDEELNTALSEIYPSPKLKYAPGQARDSRGRFATGRGEVAHTTLPRSTTALPAALVGEWALSPKDIQKEALAQMKGVAPRRNQQAQHAATLLAELETAPVHATLYRGISLNSAAAVKALKIGDTITMPPSSFSTDSEVAAGFAGFGEVAGRMHKVVFEARGVHGIDISKHPKIDEYGMGWQKEVIAGGKLRISSISQRDGTTFVVLD